jgi:hypothetical protein
MSCHVDAQQRISDDDDDKIAASTWKAGRAPRGAVLTTFAAVTVTAQLLQY